MSEIGSAITLTALLAGTTTILLFVLGTPLALWLATTRSRFKPLVETITALPLVLPPTVIGFYLLVALNPNTPIGGFWVDLTGETLTFSFAGLVVASIIYSLPFMVQPLQNAFEAVGKGYSEAAATLGASPLATIRTVLIPLSARGFLTAGVLTFAHTVGEFGVVLMVGGNIPGETRVISIAIYELVELQNYGTAHALSGGLVLFSLVVLMLVYGLNKRFPIHVAR